MKVTKDDPRYLEEDEALMAGRPPRYVHRKPSKKAKQEYAIGVAVQNSPVSGLLSSPAAQAAAVTALGSATPRILRSVPKVAKGAAALLKRVAALPVGAGALEGWLGTNAMVLGSSGIAILAAAGLTSYFTTRWIMEHYSKGARQDAALKAYLKARRDLAAHLGRELRPDELKPLYQHYQSVVAQLNAST